MPPPVLRDHYSADEFRSLIDRESDRIELKTGLGGKPLQEVLVAFSNTDGGLILIGAPQAGEHRRTTRDR